MLGALGATALVACQRPDVVKKGARVHLTGETMGSTYNVKFDRAGQPMEHVADAVGAALQAVDERMSRFRPASELNKLNDAAAGVPVPLSPELFVVLQAAEEVSKWSAGAFDVTVAPAVEAWGFGVSKQRRVPAAEHVATQRNKVGWQGLQLDAAARTATKRRPGIQADLGGIAKGYGVDAVALALEGLGIREYMVEVGGEVRTRGLNADAEPWQIGIEQPDAMPRRARYVVPLSGRSMATSGDYRIYFEQDGRRFSHEIDPVTAEPIAHRLCSVTVVANDCLHADALATALIVLGTERGYQLAEHSAVAAQFIERVAPGRYIDRMTTSFAALGARVVA
jgi:thiamine biosynthesis lipoprotein